MQDLIFGLGALIAVCFVALLLSCSLNRRAVMPIYFDPPPPPPKPDYVTVIAHHTYGYNYEKVDKFGCRPAWYIVIVDITDMPYMERHQEYGAYQMSGIYLKNAVDKGSLKWTSHKRLRVHNFPLPKPAIDA